MKKINLLLIMALICSLLSAAQNQEEAKTPVFPSFSANNLFDNNITVPDSVSPRVEVAVMTFSRQDIAQTDAWINTFTSLYKGNTAVVYSQTAVIGEIPFIGGLIINGMKGSLAKDKWERFLIYTGDKEKLTKSFNVENPALFHVYVIGKDGRIKWSVKSAKASDEEVASMLEAVKKELVPEQPKKVVLKAGKKQYTIKGIEKIDDEILKEAVLNYCKNREQDNHIEVYKYLSKKILKRSYPKISNAEQYNSLMNDTLELQDQKFLEIQSVIHIDDTTTGIEIISESISEGNYVKIKKVHLYIKENGSWKFDGIDAESIKYL